MLIILATISINVVLGENGLIQRAEKAAEHQANAEAKDNELFGILDDWISNKLSKEEEHGIYFNQPYNAVFDMNGDNALEQLTLVVYEDGNYELFINQITAENQIDTYGSAIQVLSQYGLDDIVVSQNGTILSVADVDFKLNTETHDIYFGEMYYSINLDSVTFYALYENGSCVISNLYGSSQTLPEGTCVYDEGKITFGEDTLYVSMDGTQVIMPGSAIISRNTIQFDKLYFGYRESDEGEWPQSYVFHKDGSAEFYKNGLIVQEMPAGTVKCENNFIYVYSEGEWAPFIGVVSGGTALTDFGGYGNHYTIHNELVTARGTFDYDVINEGEYINNGELTIPEYWIGNDGIKYITDGVYLYNTNEKDIKSIVIPNSARGIGIACPSVEEFKVNADNPNYRVEDGVLYNKDKTELIEYPGGKKDTTFKVPDGVTHLRWNMYWPGSNSHVTTLIIPRSLDAYSYYDISNIFPSVTTINYEGTEEEWKNMEWPYGEPSGVEINFGYEHTQ